MKENKTAALSLRLPADLMQLLDERASAEHLTRTDIALAALREYLGVATAPAASDKLDRVIELLETIAGNAPQRKTVQHAEATQRNTPSGNEIQRNTARAADPRFHAVDPEADAMIVRMSAEGAGLADITNALNALGFTSATGQEWTRSRLRDYRHKLRDSGLLNG
ncbi:recombinase family protein [Enterobacter roggenkampii]|uniref:recombinase family protein n=1 Tax=Enterobacter roggenkampii TaxID=1812935 RepID=UPI0022315A2F|nr:recombinase family protein [Enterobacter roggenkampii]MDM9078455.1 recombinase family protein [Enterobacter roggenkampii]